MSTKLQIQRVECGVHVTPTYPPCGHAMCRNLPNVRTSYIKSVSIVVYTKDYFVVGECGMGKNYGQVMTCSGKVELWDQCFAATAIREMREELKLPKHILESSPRFECASILGSKVRKVVFLFNCTDLDIAAMQHEVKVAYSNALTVLSEKVFGNRVPSAMDLQYLRYTKDEPKEVTVATTNGEMRCLHCIPHKGISYDCAGILTFSCECIEEMLRVSCGKERYSRDTDVVWTK